MRSGVTLSVAPADLDRLQALVKDRNAPQKHVWRAQIVLLSAEGVGTNAIMRETGKAKTYVWRWQERFAAEGLARISHGIRCIGAENQRKFFCENNLAGSRRSPRCRRSVDWNRCRPCENLVGGD